MTKKSRNLSGSYPASGARAERRMRGMRTDAVLFRDSTSFDTSLDRVL